MYNKNAREYSLAFCRPLTNPRFTFWGFVYTFEKITKIKLESIEKVV